eukprot:TRINITY_DN21270_c0_g1_i1.p1 TRINITY_DN21270_c0_g1~~TRINITY_DN21270_c0_g1_i1.p1  ORF type:complete len:132 (-),score=35.10 TRINITY_DN21270_c0_g1_i1:80-475(-)
MSGRFRAEGFEDVGQLFSVAGQLEEGDLMELGLIQMKDRKQFLKALEEYSDQTMCSDRGVLTSVEFKDAAVAPPEPSLNTTLVFGLARQIASPISAEPIETGETEYDPFRKTAATSPEVCLLYTSPSPRDS